MATRSMQDWFDAYGESHQNPTNKLIHWICVPTIFFSILGLIFLIRTPALPVVGEHLVLAVVTALVLGFYFMRSKGIFLGMILWLAFCWWLAMTLEPIVPMPFWAFCLGLFVLAWIGQFYGHKVEGKKPSFFEDLQFLMIGPAWLMGFIYRRLGIGY